ncbi:MAG TPA: tripartite tricarboxylate transporter substrate binding protein [Reyranella sp.]|nr:tripartite tricarboxylate transporter substrate binding protein [Reyranella sp.]
MIAGIGRRLFATTLGASLLPLSARAEEFPAHPITLIVPFAAGGSMDVLARLVASQASKDLGRAIVIDNRGGAAGLIGAMTVAHAEPDGYTLLMASAAQVTIAPWVNSSLAFDPPKDLAPICQLVDTPMALIVSAGSDMRSVGDFIQQARSHRGQMNYGSTGVGSVSHLVMESLKLAADIDVMHVPYRGAAPALNDLQGGQIQGMFTSTASVGPLVAAGKLRALAVTSPARSQLLPDVPTMAEAGWPTAEVVVWMGIMAPHGLPPTVKSRLERAFTEAVLSPEIREKLAPLGADPVGRNARDFAQVLAKDLELWRRVALASGVKAE